MPKERIEKTGRKDDKLLCSLFGQSRSYVGLGQVGRGPLVIPFTKLLSQVMVMGLWVSSSCRTEQKSALTEISLMLESYTTCTFA